MEEGDDVFFQLRRVIVDVLGGLGDVSWIDVDDAMCEEEVHHIVAAFTLDSCATWFVESRAAVPAVV